jgi:hypothetical protein
MHRHPFKIIKIMGNCAGAKEASAPPQTPSEKGICAIIAKHKNNNLSKMVIYR